MSKPNLKVAEPPRSPERAALAELIARHAEAVREAEVTEAAYQASFGVIVEAEEALERANAALGKAPTDAAEYRTSTSSQRF